MKLKIKMRLLDPKCKPSIIEKGDWFDLYTRTETILGKNESKKIPLGICAELPEEFEAWIVLRSSTPSKYKIIMINHFGIIDYTYSGNEDEWKCPVLRTIMNEYKISKEGLPYVEMDNEEYITIPAYTKICQFRIFPSQKASVITKLRWLISHKVEIEYVDNLTKPNRGGFGSTGN